MSKLIILKSISINTFTTLMLSGIKQSDLNKVVKLPLKLKKINSLKAVRPKLRNPKNVFSKF